MVATKRAFERIHGPIGSHWRSSLPVRELREQIKRAAFGPDNEQGFEQSFSSLAYTYVKSKAPRLLDFVVGFQLLDRDQDGTKAAGVFGFKVGDLWIYAPSFFINGDVKGHELQWIKNQDLFVPLKENWVNYVISRKPHALGESSDKNTFQLGGMMPNISRLSYPPSVSSKFAADLRIAEWARPALPMFAALATLDGSRFYRKQASVRKDRFDLREFINDLPMLKAAYEHYKCHPLVKQGFDRFYGEDFWGAQALKIRENLLAKAVKEAGSYILPPKKKRRPLAEMLPTDQDREAEIKKAVDVIVSDDVAVKQNLPDLTDAEREKLMKDTVLIRDKRDPHATSMVYDTQVRTELTNPAESGVYDVLERPGVFTRMLVLRNPKTGDGQKNGVLVFRKGDKGWLLAHPGAIWARPLVDDKETLVKYVEGLDGSRDLQKGATYVAIASNGDATCPFEIRDSFGEGVYRVWWDTHFSWRAERPSYLPDSEGSSRGCVSTVYDNDVVRLADDDSSKLRARLGELTIPKGFKILKLKDKPSENESYEEREKKEPRPIEPGNLADVQLMLREKTASLSVFDMGGGEMFLKAAAGPGGRMTKRAALICLVRDHGLTEEVARETIKRAAAAGAVKKAADFRVKYAFGYPSLQPGPSAPGMPEPMYGTEQIGYGSVQSTYPHEEHIEVPELSAHLTDPTIYDPFYKPDQQAMGMAQQASASGRRELFDVANLVSLLKSPRAMDRVDDSVGDLLKSVDKLGRDLLLFYWHPEVFEERYGKEDLPELEDSLRNEFEGLGDLVLWLMEKTVKGSVGLNLASGVGNSQAEPSIDSTARS